MKRQIIFRFILSQDSSWEEYPYWKDVMKNLESPSTSPDCHYVNNHDTIPNMSGQTVSTSNLLMSVFPSVRDQSMLRSASKYAKADVDTHTAVSSSRNARRQEESGDYSGVMSSFVAKSCAEDSYKSTSTASFSLNTSLYGTKDNVIPSSYKGPYNQDWNIYTSKDASSSSYNAKSTQNSYQTQTGNRQSMAASTYNMACSSTYSKQKNSAIYNSLASSANEITQISMGYCPKTTGYSQDQHFEVGSRPSESSSYWPTSTYSGRDSFSADSDKVTRSSSSSFSGRFML